MPATLYGDALLFCELANKHAWGRRMMYEITPTGDVIPGFKCEACGKPMPEDFTTAETNFMHGDASAVLTEMLPLFGIKENK